MAKPTISPPVWTVYRITNTVNGKVYVGITRRTLRHRWSRHTAEARRIRSDGKRFLLSRAIIRHGPTVFTIEALASCPNRSAAMQSEVSFISRLNSMMPNGYNMTPGGDVPFKGPHSAETKARISATLKGRIITPEHAAKIAAAKLGKPQSAEWIENSRLSRLGLKPTPETRAKMSAAAKGRKRSSEDIAKRRATRAVRAVANGRLLGAYWSNYWNKWYSMIMIAGQRIYLGGFDTAKEANAAYMKCLNQHLMLLAERPAAVLPFENEVTDLSAASPDSPSRDPSCAGVAIFSMQLAFEFDRPAPN